MAYWQHRPGSTFARAMAGNVNICISIASSNFTLGDVAVISNVQISNKHRGMMSPENNFLILSNIH